MLFRSDPTRSSIYKDVSTGIATAGIESYLPLFFDHTATVFDYFVRSGDSESPSICLSYVGDIENAVTQFWKDTEHRYAFLKHDAERPILPPQDLFLSLEQFYTQAKPYPRIVLESMSHQNVVGDSEVIFSSLPDVSIHRRDADPLKRVRHLVEQNNWRVLICAESAGRLESIRQLIEESNLGVAEDQKPLFALNPHHVATIADFIKDEERFAICTSPLFNGFAWHPYQTLVITETELFTQTARQRRNKEASNTDPDKIGRAHV